jgi:hypothetical protein
MMAGINNSVTTVLRNVAADYTKEERHQLVTARLLFGRTSRRYSHPRGRTPKGTRPRAPEHSSRHDNTARVYQPQRACVFRVFLVFSLLEDGRSFQVRSRSLFCPDACKC